MMKFRTIKEAKFVQIPELPQSLVIEFKALEKIVKSGSGSAVSKLNKIFALTDKITTLIAPYMVCEKGCSHCCKIDVYMTSVEAQYIHKNLDIAPTTGHSLTSGHGQAKRPCTFLDNTGACAIYEYRPFSCRTYFTLDNPMFCKDIEVEHISYTSTSNGLLYKLLELTAYINAKQPIRDVRDFFPSGIIAKGK